MATSILSILLSSIGGLRLRILLISTDSWDWEAGLFEPDWWESGDAVVDDDWVSVVGSTSEPAETRPMDVSNPSIPRMKSSSNLYNREFEFEMKYDVEKRPKEVC